MIEIGGIDYRSHTPSGRRVELPGGDHVRRDWPARLHADRGAAPRVAATPRSTGGPGSAPLEERYRVVGPRSPWSRPRRAGHDTFRLEDCADDAAPCSRSSASTAASPSVTRWAGPSPSCCGDAIPGASPASCCARRLDFRGTASEWLLSGMATGGSFLAASQRVRPVLVATMAVAAAGVAPAVAFRLARSPVTTGRRSSRPAGRSAGSTPGGGSGSSPCRRRSWRPPPTTSSRPAAEPATLRRRSPVRRCAPCTAVTRCARWRRSTSPCSWTPAPRVASRAAGRVGAPRRRLRATRSPLQLPAYGAAGAGDDGVVVVQHGDDVGPGQQCAELERDLVRVRVVVVVAPQLAAVVGGAAVAQ